jgi:RNA polymerase sigma-70 factor, ECF subfamily
MTAQDQVIQAYEDAREDVYHYLLRLGLDAGQAQEATQEVFLRLFLVLGKGETVRNPRAWAFRVAHNLGLNLRRERNHIRAFDRTLAAAVPDDRPGPEAHAIARQRAEMMERALAELSPQQRQCLHLRAEGLRYHEIAATIGIGVSTVGEFLSRAMTRLRSIVHE